MGSPLTPLFDTPLFETPVAESSFVDDALGLSFDQDICQPNSQLSGGAIVRDYFALPIAGYSEPYNSSASGDVTSSGNGLSRSPTVGVQDWPKSISMTPTSTMLSSSTIDHCTTPATPSDYVGANFVSLSARRAGIDPHLPWSTDQFKSPRTMNNASGVPNLDGLGQDIGVYSDEDIANIDDDAALVVDVGKSPIRSFSTDSIVPGALSNSRSKGKAVVAPKDRSASAGDTGMPAPSIHLRTASRKAKRTSSSYRPASSPKESKARNSHNNVEKQYRNRLNQQFEHLLAILPISSDSDKGPTGEEDDIAVDADRRLSKAEVLNLAQRYIRSLEKQTSSLQQENQELVNSITGLARSSRSRTSGLGS